LTGADLRRARAAGVDDAAVLHAILQTSLFGHLNRIADAVGVEVDYPDSFDAPHVEPATPPYLWPECAPDPHTSRPIELNSRPGTIELLSAWRGYSIDRDSGALSCQDRGLIASAVAVRLGDATVTTVEPRTSLQTALVDLADVVTLAPWNLGP